ncbi:MAG: hypothetical protein ABL876_18535, partial [Chitinophagaceae bacterium]
TSNDPVVENEPAFRLIKLIDSIASLSKEDKVSFYYAPSGVCDSIISQYQQVYLPNTPFWSYSRLRLEYNSSQLPVKAFKWSPSGSEHQYSEIFYDGNGRKIKHINYNDTYTYTYDHLGRLARDTQFSSFGYWLSYRTYLYDSKDNVLEWKSFSTYSADSAFVRCTYDKAINPLRKDWNLLFYDPRVLSRNNLTSMTYVNTSNAETVTYVYNALNLPVKARIYNTNQAEPVIRTYIYQ